jgi:uroporphyrinogen decarboxylase
MSKRGLFRRALAGEVLATPPIWMMRQAGRYHAPYQKLRQRHSFEALCRTPELAAEVALAPVADFDFDAAILFSDLLFPLEALGMNLSYDEGPPSLSPRLTASTLESFRPLEDAAARLSFQREAMAATRAELAGDKGLIGFVGGPWTLFVYAVEGNHAAAAGLAAALSRGEGLVLYRAFADRMVPLLAEAIRMQFEGGADVVMIFDTAAGDLTPEMFRSHMVSDLAALANRSPGPVGYYAKGVGPAHVRTPEFESIGWAGLGFDWRWDLSRVLTEPRERRFVQGNFDPELMLLTGDTLRQRILSYLEPLRALDSASRRGWICGLGHGVLQHTPEASVRTFVRLVRESFA